MKNFCIQPENKDFVVFSVLNLLKNIFILFIKAKIFLQIF